MDWKGLTCPLLSATRGPLPAPGPDGTQAAGRLLQVKCQGPACAWFVRFKKDNEGRCAVPYLNDIANTVRLKNEGGFGKDARTEPDPAGQDADEVPFG
jgi:hypothetical protein